MSWKSPTTALWYRVSSLRPRLRPHVSITRQYYRDELWYLFEDQAHNRFHRFRPIGYAAVGLMDGSRTVDEIWHALDSHGDERPTQDDIIQLLTQLDAADLLATEQRPDFKELSRRAQATGRSKWIRRLTTPLFLQVPLFDPDALLSYLEPPLRFFWSWPGFFVWFTTVTWGAAQAWLNWAALTHDFADRVLATDNLVILVLVFPVLKILHEIGHGVSTKIFGGHVHECGILTMALVPMPYIDVTSSTRFDARHRAIVGASGMMVETFLASIALAIWLHLEPGAPRAAAFNVMLIAGVSTLVFNGNPLLRFDAYYIMADVLGITNFATRAGQYYGYLVNRYLFGRADLVSPANTRGERLWFLAYAPFSYAYRLFVLFSIALFLAGLWRGLGAVIALWTIGSSVLLPMIKGMAFVTASPTLRRLRARAVAVTAFGLVAIYAVIFVMPLHYGTVVEGVVWAPEEAEIHADVEGQLNTFDASANKELVAGQRVATLTDALLEDRARIIDTEQREVSLRYEAAEGQDEVQAHMLRQQIAYFTATLNDIRTRLAHLTIVSPVRGQFLATFPQDLPGRFLKRGDLIGYSVDGRTASIRVVVPQSEIDTVRHDTLGVDLRFADDPFRVWHVPAVIRELPIATRNLPSAALSVPGGGSISIDPSDQKKLQSIEVVFEMDLPIPAGVAVDRLGERVFARFDHGYRTIGWYISRRLRQLFLERLEL